MARVQLIVTGVMEEKALARSLQAVFPEHEFECKPRLDGFTSSRLPPDLATLTATQQRLLNLDKFVKAMIGVFAPGARVDRARPDFVVGIDDVELVNAEAPANITRAVREALRRELAGWPGGGDANARLKESMRDRCSFHLMAPMTEAYFFADRETFVRATGGAAARPSLWDDAQDAEAFLVEDEAYSAAPQMACRWAKPGRERHPKHYLEFLTDPRCDDQVGYRETTLGSAALAALSWGAMLQRSAALRFARSLIADLAEMLDAEPVGCSLATLDNAACNPLTWPPPRDQVVRNL